MINHTKRKNWETRPKRTAVERACKELGYQPDGVAAALRSRSSKSVGILVPDITNPIFPAVIRAAEHELSQAALDLVLCDADNDVDVEAQRIDTLTRRRVDAVVVCPVRTENRTKSSGRPVGRPTQASHERFPYHQRNARRATYGTCVC